MARKKSKEGEGAADLGLNYPQCVKVQELRAQADELLNNLNWLTREATILAEKANAEIAAINERYQEQLAAVQARIKDNEAALVRLMKAGRAVFFAAGDIHALVHGSLLRQVENKVTLHGKKDEIIARAEQEGLDYLVKVEKSLDRDQINKLSAALLALLGAERKALETFNYDLNRKMAQ